MLKKSFSSFLTPHNNQKIICSRSKETHWCLYSQMDERAIGKNGVAGNRTQNLLHSVMLRRAVLRRCHTTRPQPHLMSASSALKLYVVSMSLIISWTKYRSSVST